MPPPVRQSLTPAVPSTEVLGIICGAGALPFAVADAAMRAGRRIFLMPITGWADAASVDAYPHQWVTLGQFGRLCRVARDAGVRDIVCVGGLTRPALRNLRLDWATVLVLPRLYRLFRGGDDHLLSGIAGLFEERGFHLLGAHEVAPEIVLTAGSVGRVVPRPEHLADAAHGFALIQAMGPFDVGQAVVVANRRVLAVEAAEGTDAMLVRVAELRSTGRISGELVGQGVLVKAPKPGQDWRMDLPSIGPATAEAVRQAGLAGIAARAGGVIVSEPKRLIDMADACGVFIAGIAEGPRAAP